MPESWLIRRYRRHQAKVFPLKFRPAPKLSQRKYLPAVKLLKLFAAILVPLMIGAFTVVTTIQESNNTRSQREADFKRVERQAKLQDELEQRKSMSDMIQLHEQQEHADRMAKEARIQNVFDGFLRDLNIIVLKPNANLTLYERTYVRSRTLSALRQVDSERQWHIIKYLYDSELLYVREKGYQYVDLGGTVLSNVRFGSTSRLNWASNLQHIRLSNLDLVNSTFTNVDIRFARFAHSDLSNSTFDMVSFVGNSFLFAKMENVNFDLIQVENVSFIRCNLKGTTWNIYRTSKSRAAKDIDFSHADLSNSILNDMNLLSTVLFQNTTMDEIQFNNVKFGSNFIIQNVSLKRANFSSVFFFNFEVHDSDLTNVSFLNCTFDRIRFYRVNLQNSQFNSVPASSKINFDTVNLIGSNYHQQYKSSSNFSNSILPNGTFVTTFRSFNVNLLTNYGAEEGECHKDPYANITKGKTLIGWQNEGNITQLYYNSSHLKIEDIKEDWGSCIFYGGIQQRIKTVVLRQEVDVSALTMLFQTSRVFCTGSGYLGGIGNQTFSVSIRIIFAKGKTPIKQFDIGIFIYR